MLTVSHTSLLGTESAALRVIQISYSLSDSIYPPPAWMHLEMISFFCIQEAMWLPYLPRGAVSPFTLLKGNSKSFEEGKLG